MKRTIIALTVAMSLFAVGCGFDINTKNDDSEGVKHSYESFQELPDRFDMNGLNLKYSVDVPNNELMKNHSLGYIYNKNKESDLGSYRIVYDHYDKSMSYMYVNADKGDVMEPEDVFTVMEKQMIFAVRTIPDLPTRSDYEVDILKKESLLINNWNMCRVEGKFHILNKKIEIIDGDLIVHDYVNFVAYSVIKESTPLYFMVLDTSNEDSYETIGKVAEMTAKTFRTYEGD